MRWNLTVDQVPSAWFNVAPHLPAPMQPPLHPATKEPVGPDDLAPLFPMALIGQEVSADPWIDVPGEVLDILRLWRPTPLVRAVDTTHRIARGDLAAKVEVHPHDYPELAELADSINAMAASLERARGLERQFLLSVSHELRTPLTSIRGYADALADGIAEDVPGALAVIGAEAKRLERIVQDLLDLARLDARRFSLHPQRVDCADVVAGVADGFRPEIGAAGLAVEVRVEDAGGTGLWVDADPDRLAQIVANLVENASKFAASRIEVGARAEGETVLVWVADDGPGIRPEDRPHVFDRHFTSDRVPSRQVGTGLGLAIVAELTAAMHAGLRLDSPVLGERGTRVVVSMASARG